MTSKGGISGTAVIVASVGAVLVYAGFRGVSPIEALREVAGGHPQPLFHPGGVMGSLGGQIVNGMALRSAVVAASNKYASDKYSQLKRTQNGYSDCSSFVDKCLKDAGINPPGSAWANTTNFLAAADWRTIPQAEAQAGDIAVAVGHMVLITGSGGSSAVGQENVQVGVRHGEARSLFSKTQLNTLVFRTYKGYNNAPAVASHTGGGVST